VRITALSEVLPGEPVTNSEMARRFGLHEQWLERMTGNRCRYFCSPDSPAGVPKSTGDLATAAGAQALATAGVSPEDIDFLILTTASPDHLMPATVNLVAERLGINGVPTLQLASGCAGALQGLYTARALLHSGLRRGLVIGADTCLKLWPSARDLATMRPAEMINFALFGDGGGAAVVEADRDGPGFLVDQIVLRTIGQGRKPAQVIRWYGTAGAPTVTGPNGVSAPEPMGEEDYKAIERHVPEAAAQVLNELSELTGWRPAEVDRVLTPQLNGVMTEKIREHLGVRPDQAVSCVAETGNNGNALPFIQLRRALAGMDRPGARVLVTTIESSKWIISGMALRLQEVPSAG